MVVQVAIVGAVFALPGTFVLLRTLQLGDELVSTLRSSLAPLGRTMLLAVTVSATAAVLGTALAWLLVRSDLPARNVLRILVVLPLVLPSFVGAAAFLAALANGGVLHGALSLFGVDPPRLRGFWPSWFVLSLFTYPYVFLPVAARLLALSPALEESARMLGRSAVETFRDVTLPQLNRSIGSGALLVFLYTVSEFGAVQLLGYDTLTRVIFATRLSDRATSFTASLLLIALALVVVMLERSQHSHAEEAGPVRVHAIRPVKLRRWRAGAGSFVAVVCLFGLLVPIASLATWAWRGIADGRVGFDGLLEAAWNTAGVGVLTAIVAVATVLPLAALLVRHRSRAGDIASIAVVAGFAVPGLVIALSLVFWTLNAPVFGVLYQTLPLLIAAYVVHFGAQALGAGEDSIRAVPQSMRESSRLLEPSKIRRLTTVDFPLMRPSLVSGGGLVLLSTVKELPATLLLAPTGFRTLATEVWGSYEDGFYAEVGVGGLLLVALSAGLTWLLVLRRSDVIRQR
ncbi:MAG: iron ABC transporter permease [Acidimicrobiales bacterium]|nr:iron ABC transporter permease [Acidimicrobiales bacterium]